MEKVQYEMHRTLQNEKYKLKTELENLVHKNIMEEIKTGNRQRAIERRGV